jgi:hypothetical protein
LANLNTVELKAFVPAKDFNLCKNFYQDLGFTKASDAEGIAYFHQGSCSFLLQDFYDKSLAENLMMHLLVEDINAWHEAIKQNNIAQKYQVEVSDVVSQPWGMLDFIIRDPSSVLWRIGQNIG